MTQSLRKQTLNEAEQFLSPMMYVSLSKVLSYESHNTILIILVNSDSVCKSTLPLAVVFAVFHSHSLVFNFNAYLQSPPTLVVILFSCIIYALLLHQVLKVSKICFL